MRMPNNNFSNQFVFVLSQKLVSYNFESICLPKNPHTYARNLSHVRAFLHTNGGQRLFDILDGVVQDIDPPPKDVLYYEWNLK